MKKPHSSTGRLEYKKTPRFWMIRPFPSLLQLQLLNAIAHSPGLDRHELTQRALYSGPASSASKTLTELQRIGWIGLLTGTGARAGLSIAQLVQRMRLSVRQVRDALRSAQRKGHVNEDPLVGFYKLTPTGRRGAAEALGRWRSVFGVEPDARRAQRSGAAVPHRFRQPARRTR